MALCCALATAQEVQEEEEADYTVELDPGEQVVLQGRIGQVQDNVVMSLGELQVGGLVAGAGDVTGIGHGDGGDGVSGADGDGGDGVSGGDAGLPSRFGEKRHKKRKKIVKCV